MYERILTEEYARGIALKRVPGNIQKVSMDLEYGVMYYKFYILTEEDRRFKVKVNAKTGRVLRVKEKGND